MDDSVVKMETWFIVVRIGALKIIIWSSPYFLIYSPQANLIGFAFSEAVYYRLARQTFEIIRDFKIVVEIVMNQEMRVPIFRGNLPTQYAVGDRRLNQWIIQNDLTGL